MFPIPFDMNTYQILTIEAQISTKLLLFSHIPTALLAIAFGVFIYAKTKKLSALYLMLLCINFAIWLYLDLVTWTSGSESIMFAWSVLDIINVVSYFLTFWFLYSFVKDRDLPLWAKAATTLFLIPTAIIMLKSINMDSFYMPTAISLENEQVVYYNSYVRGFFLLLIAWFTVNEYRKATDAPSRKKTALAGLGAALFLAFFLITELITAFFLATNLWGWGESTYAYNFQVYGLFGVPIFLGFLGYLVAKYQAFDIKLIKSVGLVVLLMILLFFTIFI